MAKSRRQQVVEVIRERLQAITVANGFNTEAGAQVFLNESPAFGPDDPDVAVAVVIGEDDPAVLGEHVLCRVPLEIQALAKVDLAEPWIAVEQVLQDIKRAIELEEGTRPRSLGGLLRSQLERGVTRTLEREDGSTAIGCGVTYLAPAAA